MIVVKPYYFFRQAMEGRARLEFPAEGMTLARLLDRLTERFGDDLRARLTSPRTRRPEFMVLVNGRSLRSLSQGLETDLNDGDEVSLFPPVCGG